jgi:hypothetical protein
VVKFKNYTTGVVDFQQFKSDFYESGGGGGLTPNNLFANTGVNYNLAKRKFNAVGSDTTPPNYKSGEFV